MGGLFLECRDKELDTILSSEDPSFIQQQQALVEIPSSDKRKTPGFSIATKVAYVTKTGLGVAFLTNQDGLLNYLMSVERPDTDSKEPHSAKVPGRLDSLPDHTVVIRDIRSMSNSFLQAELPHFFAGIKKEIFKAADGTTTEAELNELLYGLSALNKNQETIHASFIEHIDSELDLQSISASSRCSLR